MMRPEHGREAELRYQYAVAAINAGEFIWITVVHAISAADPDHEHPDPDTFGNPHRAPNMERTYIPATRRIATPAFSASDFDQRLKYSSVCRAASIVCWDPNTNTGLPVPSPAAPCAISASATAGWYIASPSPTCWTRPALKA